MLGAFAEFGGAELERIDRRSVAGGTVSFPTCRRSGLLEEIAPDDFESHSAYDLIGDLHGIHQVLDSARGSEGRARPVSQRFSHAPPQQWRCGAGFCSTAERARRMPGPAFSAFAASALRIDRAHGFTTQ